MIAKGIGPYDQAVRQAVSDVFDVSQLRRLEAVGVERFHITELAQHVRNTGIKPEEAVEVVEERQSD